MKKMITPQNRKELKRRYYDSFEEVKQLHEQIPTVIDVAIHFMLTENKDPKDIKEIINIMKKEICNESK
jgi:hypothetical protein